VSAASELPLSAIELLAPARDAEIGMAAVDHGADAVYIGGPAFGARASAGNSLADIARLARHAHRFGARVYMTLNTIYTDAELEKARRLAFEAADAGVDVLIVQDMGLMNGPMPDIELHASTQCDIRTPEKAAFLEAAGFSQVVLARELELPEIAAVRATLKHARIEFFVHGALCVSYSGQCYISEAVTHRSANRGACAQFCRLPYDVFTEEGEAIARRSHVLSLKDNDQSENLEALIDAGVSTFKIEGRLKDIDYVKNITAFYRAKLDRILARRPELSRSSDGISTVSFTPDPEKTFNRGSTEYFVHGRAFDRPYELAQLGTPKNAGVPCADAVRAEPGLVIAKPRAGVTLANGDGLTYVDGEGILRGLSVNRAEDAGRGLCALHLRPGFLPEGLAKGTVLMRNRDRAFERALSGRTAERKIPVDIAFAAEDGSLSVTMSDGRVSAKASAPFALQKAADAQKNRASVEANLRKLGGTDFSARTVAVPDPLEAFAPASVVNRLRREAAEGLAKERERARIKPHRAPADESAPYPERELDYRANVANRAARAFYEKHGARVLQPAFEIRPVEDAALMTCRHCVRAALGRCPKTLRYFPDKLQTLPAKAFRPEPLYLVDSAGDRFRAEFHCKANPCFMTLKKA
jgi:collagenase-like PrtC family protease